MVRAHECEGLGRDISRTDAEELAAALRERAVRELESAIDVRENYEPANPDQGSSSTTRKVRNGRTERRSSSADPEKRAPSKSSSMISPTAKFDLTSLISTLTRSPISAPGTMMT